MKPLADRRARARFEVVGLLWCTLEIAESAQVVDISRQGALVRSPFGAATDSVQPMVLALGGLQTRVEGRVRHVRLVPAVAEDRDRYLIGVQFLSPTSAVVETIGHVINRQGGDRDLSF